MNHSNTSFTPLSIAVLTISDTRNKDTDTSGLYLQNAAQEAGHKVLERDLVIDDVYIIRARVSQYIAAPNIHAVLITGGTGFTARDSTPEAVLPLLDKQVEGFGELFRYLSFQEIGTATIQSRALSGLANGTVIFCLPGSTGACKTAWTGIIQPQLNGAQGPCNFVPHLQAQTNQIERDTISGTACKSRQPQQDVKHCEEALTFTSG